jgi:hypothetical protein
MTCSLTPTAWDVRQVVRWHIASQSHNGAYIVVNGGCPCDDCRCNRVDYCKHSVAVHLYRKIVTNRLNRNITAGVIELDESGNAYAKGMGIVTLAKHGSAYTFADSASLVRFSLWLAKQQQPIIVEWPVAQPAMMAA